jgi:hypothetical protein
MNNRWKWFFGIIVGLLLIIFFTWQVVKNVKIKKYLQQTAETELNKLWPERVNFSFEGVRFKFLQNEIDLKGVKFQIFGEDKNDTLASLNLNRLTVNWLSYRNLLKRDTIKIQNISFNQLNSDFPIDFEKIKPKKPADSKEKKQFKIQIEAINFANSSLFFYETKGEQNGKIDLKYDIHIENVYFDSDINPTIQNTNLKSVKVELRDLNYFLSDGFHHLSAESITLEPLKGEAFIRKLIFKPIYQWSKFAALKKVQKDHITLIADSIWFSGFEIPDTVAIIGCEIGLKNPEIYVHKDKNYEIPDDRFVPILIDKLEAAELPIFVKKLIIENMQLDYKELPKDGEGTGHFYFTEMNGIIENITNIKDSVENLDEKTLNILATAKTFGKGLLDADIRYALQSTNGYFEVKGSLAPMQLDEANEIISPLAPMKVKRGKIDKLEFYFMGDRESNTGEMVFKYSELKIEVETQKDKSLKDDLLTFVANIAVPEYNPKPNGKLRVGKIEMPKRDTRRSMFKYWVDSLMSGFKSTIGVSEAKEIEENESENSGKGFWGKLGFGKNK